MYLFEEFAKLINNDVLFIILITLIGFAFIGTMHRRKKYLLYLFGSVVITALFKFIFFHERTCMLSIIECPSSPSFPSGHAMISFAMAFFFYKDRDSFFLMTILSFIIALSRLYLGVHNIEEISAGFVFALFYFSLWWKNGKL